MFMGRFSVLVTIPLKIGVVPIEPMVTSTVSSYIESYCIREKRVVRHSILYVIVMIRFMQKMSILCTL